MSERDAYHHKDLKNALIEKGIEIVSTEGKEALSMRKLAAACGVSHAAPYAHFPGKEDLLAAMQVHITDLFALSLETTIAQNKDNEKILEALGQTYVMFFVTHPYYYNFLYTESGIMIDLTSDADAETNYKPFELYKETALEVMEKENVPEAQRKDQVIAMWALIHGIAGIATMKNVLLDEDWESKIVGLMRVFGG